MKRSPLKPGKPPKRKTKLRAIGKKGRKDRAEMDAVRPEVLARGCEFRDYLSRSGIPELTLSFPRPIPFTCAGPLDPHHAVKRSLGGSNHPSNLICLCRRHHDFTENEPALCREMGLLR